MADWILAAGVTLVAVAIGALAGLWWGVLFVGVCLIVYAIAATRETLEQPELTPDEPRLERVQYP